jgi:hypothetical protein
MTAVQNKEKKILEEALEELPDNYLAAGLEWVENGMPILSGPAVAYEAVTDAGVP